MKKKINRRLLAQVKEHFLEEPRRLAMSVFLDQCALPGRIIGRDYERWNKNCNKFEELTTRTAPPCGTVGCIAGLAVFLSNEPLPGNVAERAQKLLGLTDKTLFYPDDWPAPVFKRFQKAKSNRARAKIVAEMIDRAAKCGTVRPYLKS